MSRDKRQLKIFEWARQAFGEAESTSLQQRALRLLEESIEAFQAVGGDRDVAHKMVGYVFDREPGELYQELGDVGVCALALAAAAGLSADHEEERAVSRVLSKPIEHFTKRNAAKNAAGFLAARKPLKDQEDDRAAVGIYAVMARDPSDAIDMINECTSARTLDTLLAMLKGEGSANTDRELNALFVAPVERRLQSLGIITPDEVKQAIAEGAAERCEAEKRGRRR